MEKMEGELRQRNHEVAALKARVAEDEEKLRKAYGFAVSTLARDVSRDVPDDVVKSDIGKFFQEDFFSWCADMCATRVENQESAAEHLQRIGIINDCPTYRDAPEHLKFDMDIPDGSSSLVLLQAALATALCDAFLTNPYFLSEGQDVLTEFETDLSSGEYFTGGS